MRPLVGGFVVAFTDRGDHEVAFGALALFTAPHRTPSRVETVQMPAPSPDLLHHQDARGLSVLHALWQRLDDPPEVLFIDGPGHVHPERRGFATVAGEALGVRTVGVTKQPGVGRMEGPIGGPDDAVPLRDGRTFVGYAWRPYPPAHRPLYVSVGNALPPVGALALVRAWTPEGQAYPEPLRVAEAIAADLREAVLMPHAVA